jgi:hypothetical protein
MKKRDIKLSFIDEEESKELRNSPKKQSPSPTKKRQSVIQPVIELKVIKREEKD